MRLRFRLKKGTHQACDSRAVWLWLTGTSVYLQTSCETQPLAYLGACFRLSRTRAPNKSMLKAWMVRPHSQWQRTGSVLCRYVGTLDSSRRSSFTVNFYTLTPSGTEKEKLSLGKSQQLIRTAGNEIRSTCISMENVAPLAHTTQGTP